MIFQDHITVRRILFWDGHGAGIQIKVIASELLPCGDMGMTMEQDIILTDRRELAPVETMTMRSINKSSPRRQDAVICHDGKL